MIMGQKFKVIGSRAPRVDAPDKATGRAVFMDDLEFKDELVGVILQSPYAHARILDIDASAAKALPGVKAVLTGRDLPEIKYGVSPARYDEELLARDKVRYVGDEVACLAAVDLETALEALELIKVEYEPLPYVLTVEDALAEDAPVIHDAFPGNICAEVHQEFGDVAQGFAQSDFIRTDNMLNKRQDGAFIEPHRAVAVYDLSGGLTLYSSTQVPHYVQRTVSMVTGLDVGKVRVIKPYVGGGFGPKAEATPLDMCAAFLSIKTGLPVRMSYTREQVFLHCRARHQFNHTMKVGFKKDGAIMALDHQCTLEGGAYSSFGIATVYYAGSLLGAPYLLPNMKYDGLRIYTNKPACGAQRGHGGVIARALFEQQLDLVAEELGMDPVELRLKNIMEAGDVSCNDLAMSSLGMKECIEAVANGSDWQEKRGKLPPGQGIGMASGFFVSGAGYPIYRSETYHCTVTIKVQEDGGTVKVMTGAAEIGQGSDTAMAMIAAEAIGIPLESVRIVSGDTDHGVDLGAYSSRTTLMTGHATKQAGENVKDKVLTALAEELNVEKDRLDIVEGKVRIQGDGVDIKAVRQKYLKEHRGWEGMPRGEELTFSEAARVAYLKFGTIVGTGKYKPPVLGGKFKGAAVGTSPAYGCSAQVAQVEVDLETGQVRVLNITDAHDCGKAINLTSVEGQMEGSVSMGLGECMFEEVKFDDKGRVLNPSLGEYHIPTVMDMPRMNCIVVESNEPNGPFGAKEVGEGAIMPTIPAILNAVRDATGAAVDELPLTPERVLKAIMDKDKE
ncbi:4-hydroxybenzoyl-CoA reductase subunit alpha [Dethiosulfatarculus sandiegensis]|uniref:4-hydroxybenzoyl-CoA reductase subunit alpha n=2 Tax=Dethiosulfatarculus sandiegensis TaxID=1429043 RepID=A0A0D2HPZ0_9BACT|nr:4-hydroxybenzoyl-CoA reductase subunit alpha [Dethiosulfatarculus sandiegensis]